MPNTFSCHCSRRLPSLLAGICLVITPALCRASPPIAAQVQSVTPFLPAPPQPGSATDRADRQIFAATRALHDTERWTLAAHDADLTPGALLADFSCAAGLPLDARHAPHVVRLIAELRAFLDPVIAAQKQYWHRDRPFVGAPDAPICRPRPVGRQPSYSYPSGHTTTGWATALLLARSLPDRAPQIMERGRIFGESRVVCGVHWASDVWAGYMNGATLFDAFTTTPAYRDNHAAAEAEIAALRQTPHTPDATACAIEHRAATVSPLTR